jgi:hypothetical protein
MSRLSDQRIGDITGGIGLSPMQDCMKDLAFGALKRHRSISDFSQPDPSVGTSIRESWLPG